MKNLFLILGLLFTALTASAQNKVFATNVAYATPTLIWVGGGTEITKVRFVNTTTTNGLLKLYDAATATTNVIRPAYTSYSYYSTNYSTTHTNTAGIVVTNTYVGMYRGSTANAAVTNERTRLLGPVAIAGSATTEFDGFVLAPVHGLVAWCDSASGILEITYRDFAP